VDYLKDATDYINAHLKEAITPQMVADAVHLSSGYLMTLFKNHMNASIMEYTYRRRIEKSKSLLADKDKKISQIAVDVGVQSSQYFSVLFKKYTQMTPKEYRKTCTF
jgi:AraC-like DNA-binding protein